MEFDALHRHLKLERELVAPTLDSAAELGDGAGGGCERNGGGRELDHAVVHGPDRNLGDPYRVGEQELDDAEARGSKEPAFEMDRRTVIE